MDEYSGYEEEGLRDEKVKEPSFFDNLKYGAQGGTAGKMPGSFGEYVGRVIHGANKPKDQEQSGASQFKSLLAMLGK